LFLYPFQDKFIQLPLLNFLATVRELLFGLHSHRLGVEVH